MGKSAIRARFGFRMGAQQTSTRLIEEIRRYYHFDDPVIVQYGRWLWNVVHGDLSKSLISREPVAATYEDGFDRLRARTKDGEWVPPRTVNFITGPSRTGDIEQKIELGAHGPRRMHIVVVRD